MKNFALRFGRIPIYLFYIYLFCWLIYYHNNKIFYSTETLTSLNGAFLYISAIVVVSFGALLYCDTVLKKRRNVIFNSLFAAAILFVLETKFSMVLGITLCVFGLVVAAFELRKNEH